MRKLNLGCGFDKREGFVNADSFPECDPDVMMDIESFPWPFEDNAFDYILMKHVLEHVGATFDVFTKVMQELYRITAKDGIVEIHVPHFRHDTFWSDPTHVRAFTPLTFEMMSRRRNDDWIARKANYSMIAYAMNVDFEVEHASQTYDSSWVAKEQRGEITREQLRVAANETWNVVKELQIRIRAVK
ncbi:class I SAM-dependent methyltransferase [Brevundimonas sp. TWP2-3-2]|uniref:class I SAM-dependent methyltransferase n=1 Tax=unclassified Brevundimonas TaxID=2622653 RepID=UPI003CF2D515